jgi:hypothetical protein
MPRPPAASAPSSGRQSRLTRSATVVWLVALLFVGWSMPAYAQQPRSPSGVTVLGQVTDSESGQPIAGAVVEISELNRRVISDQNGRFRLERVRPGTYGVLIRQLGYSPLVDAWTLKTGENRITAGLRPQPIVLKGIEVQANRFERRRKTAATTVTAFERPALLATGAPTAVDFILERGGIARTTCPQYSVAFATSTECVWVRGRAVAPTVYIDEMPAIGGLSQLSHYRPHELYMVEVYGHGRHIRAYTNWFIERVAKKGYTPSPLLHF